MQITNRNIRTTIRYGYLDLLDWFDRQNGNLIGLLIAALLGAGLVGTIVRMQHAPVTMDPIIIIATPALPAMVVPTAIPQVQQVVYAPAPAAAQPRQVVAFAAPGGDVLGPIPWSADSVILGRFGDGWILTQWDNGQVWVRTSDIGASLANLAPAAPQLQPAAPVYQVVNESPAEYAAPTPVLSEAPAGPPVDQRTLLIQNRLANEHQPAAAPAQQDAYPKIIPAFPVYEARPGGPSEVDFINNTTEWRAEHCVIASDPTTCH